MPKSQEKECAPSQKKEGPLLLVMAAGMGSRYGGLKQIDPVGPAGESILEYSVFDAIRAGFEKVVFIIRRNIEIAFKDMMASKFEGRIPVEYAFQDLEDLPEGFSIPPNRKKPWGTGHAILSAADRIDRPFVVINADDFYGLSAFQSQAEFFESLPNPCAAEYSLVGYTLRNTLSDFGSVSRSICECDQDHLLQKIVERTKIVRKGQGAEATYESGATIDLSGEEKVSMNMWGFNPSIFEPLREGFLQFLEEQPLDEKREFFMTVVIQELISSGKASFRVLPTQDSWFGITYPEDKPKVMEGIRELIAKGKYPGSLWNNA